MVLTEMGNPSPAADAKNVYVARREGNGVKGGAIIVINTFHTNQKHLGGQCSGRFAKLGR